MSAIAPKKIGISNLNPLYYSINNTNQYILLQEKDVFKQAAVIVWKSNTGELATSQKVNTISVQRLFNNNRQFIKLQQSFDQQLKLKEELFSDYPKYILKEKFKYSVEPILNFSPDKVTLQLTDDLSIFYTILKGDFTVYFEHFITEDYGSSDEVIVSIFKDDLNIINFAGTLSDSLKELNNAIVPNTLISEFA